MVIRTWNVISARSIVAVPWGLVILLVGVLYGYFTPGRQNKTRMLVTGVVIGIVLGVLLGLVGMFARVNALGLGVGIVDVIVSVIVLTILFVVGVWIGDFLERAAGR